MPHDGPPKRLIITKNDKEYCFDLYEEKDMPLCAAMIGGDVVCTGGNWESLSYAIDIALGHLADC